MLNNKKKISSSPALTDVAFMLTFVTAIGCSIVLCIYCFSERLTNFVQIKKLMGLE